MHKLEFKPKSKLKEFLGTRIISISAYAALVSILLIFVFIFKEAIPIFTDKEIQKEAGVGKMTFKQVYYEGRDEKWAWQPNSEVPKYSLYPLFLGTLKAAPKPADLAKYIFRSFRPPLSCAGRTPGTQYIRLSRP